MTSQGLSSPGVSSQGTHGTAHPVTGAQAVVADAIDPARRQDVLLRVRREEGHEVSAWWLFGAFVAVSGTVVALMSLIPGGSA